MLLSVVQTAAGIESGASWTPMNENLQAYYVNALNAGTTLGAVPVHRETEDGYFSYPGNYPLTKTGETETAFKTECFIFAGERLFCKTSSAFSSVGSVRHCAIAFVIRAFSVIAVPPCIFSPYCSDSFV